jgi:hypothetical protein
MPTGRARVAKAGSCLGPIGYVMVTLKSQERNSAVRLISTDTQLANHAFITRRWTSA